MKQGREFRSAYLVIFHDPFDLYNPNKSEDFEVFLDFFIRCSQEELDKHNEISFALSATHVKAKGSQ
jgi:hypothetical protein